MELTQRTEVVLNLVQAAVVGVQAVLLRLFTKHSPQVAARLPRQEEMVVREGMEGVVVLMMEEQVAVVGEMSLLEEQEEMVAIMPLGRQGQLAVEQVVVLVARQVLLLEAMQEEEVGVAVRQECLT